MRSVVALFAFPIVFFLLGIAASFASPGGSDNSVTLRRYCYAIGYATPECRPLLKELADCEQKHPMPFAMRMKDDLGL